MKLQGLKAGVLLFGLGLVGLGLAGPGCTATVNASAGLTAPANCSVDSSVACTGGATGFSCAAGDNPEVEDTTLSCSTPTASGGQDLYCCYQGFTGSSTTCYADDSLTAACPDPTSYGYVCAAGDDPTTYDAALNCSSPTPDGANDDFCCNYGTASSSSSGGIVITGCNPDSTVSCVGGADGFSCPAGDNPENIDPSISCSNPTPSGSADLFCCFTNPSGFGASSCAPDDQLTQACPDPTSYGYVCVSGDDPSTLDPTLNCSAGVPDPDGVHDDFCCTY